MTAEKLVQESKEAAAFILKQLKGAIVSSGYNQDQVAEALGHTPASLSNWLRCNRDMPFSVFIKICMFIGASPSAIIREGEERYGNYVSQQAAEIDSRVELERRVRDYILEAAEVMPAEQVEELLKTHKTVHYEEGGIDEEQEASDIP